VFSLYKRKYNVKDIPPPILVKKITEKFYGKIEKISRGLFVAFVIKNMARNIPIDWKN